MALDGQPIELGKIVRYVDPICRVTSQALLMAPTAVTGCIGSLFLITGCGNAAYNTYLRFLLRKFSHTSYPNIDGDQIISRMQVLYPENSLVIELVVSLLLKKDEALNLSWKEKDLIHAVYYFPFPDKKKSRKAQ